MNRTAEMVLKRLQNMRREMEAMERDLPRPCEHMRIYFPSPAITTAVARGTAGFDIAAKCCECEAEVPVSVTVRRLP